MLTEKQEMFFNLILNFYKKNKQMPTIHDLMKISNFKSYASIYKYLNYLEKKEMITYDKTNKKISFINKLLELDNIIKVPIINENKYIDLPNSFLNQNKSYIAFKIHHNKLNSFMIKARDILIIEKTTIRLNNNLVLVKLNDKLQIFKYIKKDGFIHLINDYNQEFLLKSEDIIGKVVFMYRDTMD